MKGPLITSRMNKSRRQCWLHKIRVSLWIKQGRWNVVVDFVVSLEEASAGRRGASACYISNYRPIDTADTNYKALAQHKAYNNTDIQADTKTRQCETIFVAQWKKGNFLLSVFPANQHLICDGQLQWLLQVKKKRNRWQWHVSGTQWDIDWLEGCVIRQTFTAVSWFGLTHSLRNETRARNGCSFIGLQHFP